MNNERRTSISHIDSIPRGDDRMLAYCDDTMCHAIPDSVVRPRDVQDVQAIAQHCHAERIPLTTVGSRTAMTGSATTDTGIVMAMEQLAGIDSVTTGEHATARVKAGTIINDLQSTVMAQGLFYPPSPTSRFEATLGGTIATNATGDNTYKYGPTRRYIRELEIVHANGELQRYRRPNDHRVTTAKNTAGYCLDGPAIDRFIGAEGTLGIVTAAVVDLIPAPHDPLAIFVFFPTRASALAAIYAIDQHQSLHPSAMEYLDDAALRIMATHHSFPTRHKGMHTAVIFYDECAAAKRDARLSMWFEALASQDDRMPQLLEHTIVAHSPNELKRIHAWRHHIPVHVNELGRSLAEHGGGKVGSDWWVPLEHMQEMMAWMYKQSDTLGIPYLAFAHLGNGHPHVNYLCRNANEKTVAQQLVYSCCRRAVELGGGVAGEHGIGKLKHELLLIQHDHATVERMRELKRHYDPRWVLAPGNILPAIVSSRPKPGGRSEEIS